MTTITFDTFKFVERLEKAGLPRAQAAAIVEAQKDAFAEALDSSVATRSDVAAIKSDLAEVKSELKSDIAAGRADMDLLRKDIQSMELRLTVKLGTLMALAVGLIAALIKVL